MKDKKRKSIFGKRMLSQKSKRGQSRKRTKRRSGNRVSRVSRLLKSWMIGWTSLKPVKQTFSSRKKHQADID